MSVAERATALGLVVLVILATFEGWEGLLIEALR